MLSAAVVIAVLAATPFVQGENLVGNPGFEQLIADAPAQWDAFLYPQEGAFARLDDDAHEGKYAVIIHVPVAHPDNPVNNWSQNLFGDFSGQTMRVSGYAKTVEVRDAAIWVQCWRKRPLRLLETATTGANTPLFGTRDWERIEAAFTVPEGTDFMTVRCILRGQGTVWFDDVAVGDASPAPAEAAGESGEAAAAVISAGAAPAQVTTAPSTPATTATPAQPVTPAPVAAATPAPAAAAKDNARLQSAIEALRQSNEALLEEVLRLREEVTELRSRALVEGALDPTGLLPSPRPEAVPPLVPYGADWRSLL